MDRPEGEGGPAGPVGWTRQTPLIHPPLHLAGVVLSRSSQSACSEALGTADLGLGIPCHPWFLCQGTSGQSPRRYCRGHVRPKPPAGPPRPRQAVLSGGVPGPHQAKIAMRSQPIVMLFYVVVDRPYAPRGASRAPQAPSATTFGIAQFLAGSGTPASIWA